MEGATGGFRALRSRVKAAKESSLKNGASVNAVHCDRSESPRVLLGLVGEKALRYNQESWWEQEKNLNALRTAVVKEQNNLQARERNIRSIERTLNEEMERVAEKERNLDARILEITRLEARLHNALLQQEHKLQMEPQHADMIPPNNDHSDRESILLLRERELVLSRARVDEKNNHLQAKERVLNEKEAELMSFQAELERTGKIADAHIKLLEEKLNSSYTQQIASVEAAKHELEARRVHLEEREEGAAYRERATTAQAGALEQFQRLIAQQFEASLMGQEDYLARSLYLQEKFIAEPVNNADPIPPQPGVEGRQGKAAGETEGPQLKRKGTLGRFFK
ncbi:hypothetical protein PRIC1_009191 [Phytophthora ramorum]